jgi:hypothetical protein
MPCSRHGENCDARCIDPNVDNGMMTKVWGPAGWLFLHCVSFGYPYAINDQNPDHATKKEDYMNFFYYLGKVLPCKYCRDSYMEFYKELNLNNNLDTREQLTKWLYDMHNKVNHKLGVPECQIPTYEELQDKYEKFRAKCKKTTEEERELNKSKGCIAPADGTAKRAIVKIVNFNKGDITRRNNVERDFSGIPNQDEYVVFHKNTIIYGIMFIVILISMYILMQIINRKKIIKNLKKIM